MCPQASPDYGGLLGLIVTKINQILSYLPAPAQVKYAWKYQTPAYVIQSNPVQNTWYTVLPTTDDIRVLSIVFSVQATGETLELEIVIDGITVVVSQAALLTTDYFIYHNSDWVDIFRCNVDNNAPIYRASLVEAQSMQVRVRKTTNAGTGDLRCFVIYETLLPT